jgi:hypothetical protein
MSRTLWEILVPTQFNDGTPIRTRRHREWDRQMRAISGGLTILKPARGQWVCPEGKLFHERMIPVRILATESEMRKKIIPKTIRFYQQEAVMAYEISQKVLLIHVKEIQP